jgi:fucose permease
MGLLSDTRVLVGLALILVGSVLFVPAVLPNTSQLFTYALFPAALLLTVGTWLVGTAGESSPV